MSVALIIFGAVYPTPEKKLQVSPYYFKYDKWSDDNGIEYVGGDAYNYQIEASLKGGYMSGVIAMKSICIVGGLLLLFISIFEGIRMKAIEQVSIRLVQGPQETKDISIKAEENKSKNLDPMQSLFF